MKLLSALLILIFSTTTTIAQSDNYKSQSRSQPELVNYQNGGAFKILITSYGFGLGGFYRHQFSNDLAYQFETEISPGKDEREVESIDWYGRVYTPNKYNSLLLIPFQNVLQYRLFSQDIEDNFRPFVSAGLGPLMGFHFPTRDDFFSGLGKGQAAWGITASLGLGADFGSNFSQIQGLSFRYTFNYLPDGVVLLRTPYTIPDPSDPENLLLQFNDRRVKNFHSLHLSLNIGKMWLN